MAEHAPASTPELVEIVSSAAGEGRKLELRGGGSKRDIGAPHATAELVQMRAISGVVDYDPAELVMTVRAGTRLAEMNALLARERQMLAFEPFDHGPIFGRNAGEATIGGIVAAAVAGPRRLSRGGARDHLLGFEAVSGRGERFIAGGKVVKNVTGYDLPKLMTGSWGRLAALTELTLKVLPAPESELTVELRGLEPARAYAAMARALGSPAEVAAGAHLVAADPREARTALRLEGFAPSIAARRDLLLKRLEGLGTLYTLAEREARTLWDSVITVEAMRDSRPLWRVCLPPRTCAEVLAALGEFAPSALIDWGGGLLWLACDAPADKVRSPVAAAGGHAMLVRAPADLRHSVPTFHPRPASLAHLEERVRESFDPKGVFRTPRFAG